jgi:predicted Rdx family selenoprotein
VPTYGVSYGSSGLESAGAIALEPGTGGVFIAGYMSSATSSFRMGATNLTNSGGDDAWVAKLNRTGGAVWAKRWVGTSTGMEYANQIASDAAGDCYVSGPYSSSTLTVGSVSLTNLGSNDVYVTKLNPATGATQWARSIGGTRSEYTRGMAADQSSAAVYVAFEIYSPTVTLATIPSTTLTNSDSSGTYCDVAIVKLNTTTGSVLWGKIWGISTANEFPRGVATDSSGNVYLAGDFPGATITIGITTLTNSGSGTSDTFLVKLSSTGSVVWVRQWGGSTGDDKMYGTAVSYVTNPSRWLNHVWQTDVMRRFSSGIRKHCMLVPVDPRKGGNGLLMFWLRSGVTHGHHIRLRVLHFHEPEIRLHDPHQRGL